MGHPLSCIAWFVSTYIKLCHLGCKSSIIYIRFHFPHVLHEMWRSSKSSGFAVDGSRFRASRWWCSSGGSPSFTKRQDGMGFACHHLLVYSKARHRRLRWSLSLHKRVVMHKARRKLHVTLKYSYPAMGNHIFFAIKYSKIIYERDFPLPGVIAGG